MWNKPGPAEFPPIVVITWLKNVAIVCLKMYKCEQRKGREEAKKISHILDRKALLSINAWSMQTLNEGGNEESQIYSYPTPRI